MIRSLKRDVRMMLEAARESFNCTVAASNISAEELRQLRDAAHILVLDSDGDDLMQLLRCGPEEQADSKGPR